MRILLISDVFFPRINGVSTSILTFRRELERLGHQVYIIAPDYGERTRHEERIFRIPSKVVIIDKEDRQMSLRAAVALKPELEQLDLDLIHIQTPFVAHYAGRRLARELGLPLVLSYHTYFEEYLYYYVKFLPKRLLRYLVRSFSRSQCADVDAVVVPTSAFGEVLRGYGIERRIDIIPTGIDLSRFQAGEGARFRRAHGIGERPMLLFVGRMVHEKNIDFLLRVMARLRTSHPEALFVMAGEGPAETHLKGLVRKLDLASSCLFVGNIHHFPDLLDCYAAADLLLFSSRTETQGLVLLEAMALGVPVVSNAVLGTRDILAPERGAWVVEERVEDYREAIATLLDRPEQRARLSAEARDYVQSWSAAAMAENMLALYSETVGRYGESLAPRTQQLEEG